MENVNTNDVSGRKYRSIIPLYIYNDCYFYVYIVVFIYEKYWLVV